MTRHAWIGEHPDAAMLLDYLDDLLDDAVEEAIEDHLLRCDDCAALGSRATALAEVWPTWNAAAHVEVESGLRVLRSLEQAAAAAPKDAIRARLRSWRDTFGNVAEAAVHAVIDTTAEARRLAAESLDAVRRPGSRWHLTPVPAFGGAWGEADDDEPVVTLACSDVVPGEASAHLEVRGGPRAAIVVRIDDPVPHAVPPLVILCPARSGDDLPVRIEEVPSSGTRSRIVRFRDLPAGEYLVLVEPLAGDATADG